MLARRGYNVQSLAVGHSEVEGRSRITTVIPGSSESTAKLIKQLNKVINVVKVWAVLVRLASSRLRMSFASFCQHMSSQPVCIRWSPLHHPLQHRKQRMQYALHVGMHWRLYLPALKKVAWALKVAHVVLQAKG